MSVDPIVIAERRSGARAEVEIRVPEDLRYFDGHFPDLPLVPGVVQIRWAVSIARRCFELPGGFAGLEAVKFQSVMPPGAVATLLLERSEDARKVRFSFHSGAQRYSSGRVVLRAPDAASPAPGATVGA